MKHTQENYFNIASTLKESSKKNPYKKAVIVPKKNNCCYFLTFKQFDKKSDALAYGLKDIGFKQGTKTIVMVKPSAELFLITSALFKLGAPPIIVDPGMGLKRMIMCLEKSSPNAFIGIPLANIIRKLHFNSFKSVKLIVSVGNSLLGGGVNIKKLYKYQEDEFEIAKTKENDTAAILFTTGSTGPAKGVIYTHLNFKAQIESITNHFNIEKDEIDLPTFPLFALFDPAIGMTAVIPDMDPRKPAKVDPKKIIDTVETYGVTNMFASPALLNRVGSYAKRNNIRLNSLKRVVSAGAPVLPSNIKQFSFALNQNTLIHTPYGATETLPVTSITSDIILSKTKELSEKGFGTCIGTPVGKIDVKLIKITDDPIKTLSNDILLKKGAVGEIAVSGDLVTTSYFNDDKENKLSKFSDGTKIWHRMGDLAWLDKEEKFWFCGRKNHRVVSKTETFYTIPCEAIFNNHIKVFRSALVGIGDKNEQIPVMCIETKDKILNKSKLRKELIELGRQSPVTKNIKIFLFHKSFPVDIRHNSKIFREKLAVWAEKRA